MSPRSTAAPNVFGLGSILCELLTGRPAYTGGSGPEVFRKASRGDTADVLDRLRDSGADAELLTLARDCLAFPPADRPRDAGVVAARLTAYLAGVQDYVLHAAEHGPRRRQAAGRALRGNRTRGRTRRWPKPPTSAARRGRCRSPT